MLDRVQATFYLLRLCCNGVVILSNQLPKFYFISVHTAAY